MAAHTGHASTTASHQPQRHRCRHGSSSTHASAAPHARHAALVQPLPRACLSSSSSSGPPSCRRSRSGSKQHDRASSTTASPSPWPSSSAAPAHGACWRRSCSSVARRPAAAASWPLAMPCHACPSAPISRTLSPSSALRASARARSASAARRRRAAPRSTADTTARTCRRRASSSPARSLSFCMRCDCGGRETVSQPDVCVCDT